MSETPPFPPFNPAAPPAPTQVAESSAPESRRRGRGPNKPKPEGAADQPRQTRKKANGDKPSIKLDLKTALQVAGMLNADDQPTFEKLVDMLQEAGKPARDRLLAAIGKVFA